MDLGAVTAISSVDIALFQNLLIAVKVFFFFSFFSTKHRFLAAGVHLKYYLPYISYGKNEVGTNLKVGTIHPLNFPFNQS